MELWEKTFPSTLGICFAATSVLLAFGFGLTSGYYLFPLYFIIYVCMLSEASNILWLTFGNEYSWQQPVNASPAAFQVPIYYNRKPICSDY